MTFFAINKERKKEKNSLKNQIKEQNKNKNDKFLKTGSSSGFTQKLPLNYMQSEEGADGSIVWLWHWKMF